MDAADVQTKTALTLRQWLNRQPGGTVSSEQALDVITQLTSAIHKVHIEHPFHRDVIPSTVVVTEKDDGSFDFSVPDLASVAENHGEAGAVRYLAPEQWWGARQNTATDQYALAVLFVEMVTGEVPFAGAFATEDENVMRNAVCEHRPKLPEDCPKRTILLRALSKDPRSRFHSCSSFVRALSAEKGDKAEKAETDEDRNSTVQPISRKPASRPVSKFKMLLVLVFVAGGIVWGVKSGFFARFDNSREMERMNRLAEFQKFQAQKAANEAKMREERLAGIRAELVRQEKVAAQALTNLQTFLERDGAAVLTVRRETLDQVRRKTSEELKAIEKEIEKARATEGALVALKMRSTAYGNVASDIPDDSEVAQMYKVLVKESAKLTELSGTFTEKHPSVASQKAIVSASLKQFFNSIDGGLKLVRGTLAANEKRVMEVRAAANDAQLKFEEVSRELQVAQLKHGELERVRAREADRLVELRRLEFDVQFGAASAPTNTPFK